MIKISFYKRNGVYFGFKESGHAGFDEYDKDIVCSAVSSMTMLVVNAIETSYNSEVDYKVDEKSTDVEIFAYGAFGKHGEDENQQYAIRGLIEAYYIQLIDMIEDYGDYISVEEKEA